MGAMSNAVKQVAQSLKGVGGVPPEQMGKISDVIGKVLKDGAATRSMAGLEKSIAQAIKQSMAGVTPQSEKAITEMVKMADGSVKPGDGSVRTAELAKLQQLLQREKSIIDQFNAQMKVIHSEKAAILGNMR